MRKTGGVAGGVERVSRASPSLGREERVGIHGDRVPGSTKNAVSFCSQEIPRNLFSVLDWVFYGDHFAG